MPAFSPVLRGALCCCALFCLLLASHSSLAHLRFSGITPGRNIALGSWSTVGGITQTLETCIISTANNSPNSPPTPYQVRMRNDIAGLENAVLQLVNQADATQIIPASVDFTDVYTAATETLLPNVWTLQNKSGAANKCPSGVNARFDITLQASDLAAVTAGNYQASFLIEGQGGVAGAELNSFTLTLNLTIDSLIQVSGLNDLLFPFYTGTGNLLQTDTFCIYRNSAGTYQVTFSGSGTGGAFSLSNGVQELPYQLTFNDGTGAIAVTAGTALTGRQNVFTANQSCDLGAADNATLEVTLLQADLNNAGNGNYSGILTLMVAPE